MADLERCLKDAGDGPARVVVVDGVYSMQGTMGPLKEICELAHRHGARVFVDDAHGTGVCGEHGRGTAEHYGVEDQVDLHLGTFSKAVGTTGGFAAGEKAVVDYIRYFSPTLIFTKTPPAAVVATTTKALELVAAAQERRAALWRNARQLQEGLRARGFDLGRTQTPITPIRFRGMRALYAAYHLRRSYGIWVAPVIYPAVPPRQSILRATPTALHAPEDINSFMDALEAVCAEEAAKTAAARRKAVIRRNLPFWRRWGLEAPGILPKHPTTGQVEVRPVRSRRDLDVFLELPRALYQGDPCWVPPIAGMLKDELDPEKNPFYEHAERELFVAWRGRAPVGRVAAIENRAHNEFHGERVAFFGYFETADDQSVTSRLVDAVRDWARSRGLGELRGPASPGLHGLCGLLVQGYDSAPVLMMPYNPPSYPRLLEGAELRKLKDLYAYLLTTEAVRTGMDWARLERLKAMVARKFGDFRLRTLNMKRFASEVRDLWAVFEEARRENWGYVPMTDRELRRAVEALRHVVDPRLVIVAEIRGRPVGCVVALPNLNQLIRKIKGSLWPFGWLTLLRERKHITGLRVIALGTLKAYRHLGITSVLLQEVIRQGMEAGYQWAEASWVLEDNLPSVQTIEKSLGAERYKRYRLYSGVV
jgi:GNAT superfamily N-acetyltransferase